MTELRLEDLLTAKAWALLHDPPDKSWHLPEHEMRAEMLFVNIMQGTPLGGGAPERRIDNIVRAADVWASTFDRWLMAELARSVTVDFHDVLNIFDPRVRAYNRNQIPGHDEDLVSRFVKRLNELLKLAGCNKLLTYHVLYSSLEYTWGEVCPHVSPADTRAPTHTVFDHVYATSTMVNWLLHAYDVEVSEAIERGPRGWLVYIDIPGIQRIVGSSRKTTDYWAGSWLVSYTVWSLVEDFVHYLGPDVLIVPTARHNLMYKQWLVRRLDEVWRGSEGYRSDIRNKLRDLWGGWYTDKPHPVMPATVSLALPKLDSIRIRADEGPYGDHFKRLNEVLASEDGVRRHLESKIRESWMNLISAAERIEADDVVRSFVRSLFGRLRHVLERDHLQPPRIVVIDIERTYEDYVKDVNGFLSRYLEPREYENVERALERAERLVVRRKEVLRKLFYHILFCKVLSREIVRSRFKERIGVPVPRIVIDISEDRYAEKVRGVESKLKALDDTAVGLRYCTACGQRPALISFPRDVNEYLQKIAEILGDEKVLRDEKAKEDLRRKFEPIFKRGEHLCSICLVKRALRFVIEELGKFDVKIDAEYVINTEYAANVLLAELVLKKKYTSDVCKEPPGPVEWLACKLVDKSFSYDMGELFGMSTDAVKSELRKEIISIVREKGEEILGEYKLMIRGHETPRVYYAIVKGDGDSMGKVVRGELPMSAKDYAKAVVSAVIKYVPERLRSTYEDVMSLASELAEALGCTVLVSPAYHASLSAALMVTAIKDAQIVERGYGFVMYVGGDDVVALSPVETALDIVAETRRNYWALDQGGFHRLRGTIVPAMLAYGRSYGVRISHILDPMQVEIEIATSLLDGQAKEAEWSACGRIVEKDTLAISYGRTSLGELGEVVKMPLSTGCRDDVGKIVYVVKDLWLKMLEGKVSHNMPMDFESMYRDAVRCSVTDGSVVSEDVIRSSIRMLVSRNVSADERDDVMRALESAMRVVEVGESRSVHLVEHVMRALKIIRGLPR